MENISDLVWSSGQGCRDERVTSEDGEQLLLLLVLIHLGGCVLLRLTDGGEDGAEAQHRAPRPGSCRSPGEHELLGTEAARPPSPHTHLRLL